MKKPKSRRDGWTVARRNHFLDRLRAGGTVKAAAAATGMSRESAYRLRRRAGGADFAAAWTEAIATAARTSAETMLAWGRARFPHWRGWDTPEPTPAAAPPRAKPCEARVTFAAPPRRDPGARTCEAGVTIAQGDRRDTAPPGCDARVTFGVLAAPIEPAAPPLRLGDLPGNGRPRFHVASATSV